VTVRLVPLLEEAWLAIRTNRSRTALTILGIVIGVGSVISVVGVGDGAKRVVGDLLGQFGSTSLIVAPNFTAIQESRGRFRFEEITRDDIETINGQAPAVSAVTPQIQMDVDLRAGEVTANATLFGTMHQYLTGSRLSLRQGRFLDDDDDTYMRKVGVLGFDLARTLFGTENPLGRYVRVNDVVDVEIIGVLEKEDKSFISTVSDFDTSNNNRLFVPSSAIERVGGSSQIFFLTGDAVSVDRLEEAQQQILAVLDRNHGLWDGRVEKYIVQPMGQVIAMIDTATGTLTAAISIIAGIALLVAGIGIMNIMLVSVKERTREIGIRKAMGARPASILNQFLVETLVLCGGGGLFGVAFAVVAIRVVAAITKWPALVSVGVIELAVILSLVTGLVFGLYPASRAAHMDPVEALRYE
jgi:putative ABC transport system permease protein